MSPELWEQVWQKCFDEAKERSPSFDPSDYYKSGRASKAHPNKEDQGWWFENGPAFVDKWVAWRDACGLKFAEFPDQWESGELFPAIELEVWGIHPTEELHVRSFIDRVMEDGDGDLYIVDLKSGSMESPWPLQLALNNLGLITQYGVRAKWGGFWSARKGGVMKWHDLSVLTDDFLWNQVRNAKAIRDQQLFMANPSMLCNSACGVKQFCPAFGGSPENPITLNN